MGRNIGYSVPIDILDCSFHQKEWAQQNKRVWVASTDSFSGLGVGTICCVSVSLLPGIPSARRAGDTHPPVSLLLLLPAGISLPEPGLGLYQPGGSEFDPRKHLNSHQRLRGIRLLLLMGPGTKGQALDHMAWLNLPWGTRTDVGIEGESSRVVWALYW